MMKRVLCWKLGAFTRAADGSHRWGHMSNSEIDSQAGLSAVALTHGQNRQVEQIPLGQLEAGRKTERPGRTTHRSIRWDLLTRCVSTSHRLCCAGGKETTPRQQRKADNAATLPRKQVWGTRRDGCGFQGSSCCGHLSWHCAN